MDTIRTSEQRGRFPSFLPSFLLAYDGPLYSRNHFGERFLRPRLLGGGGGGFGGPVGCGIHRYSGSFGGRGRSLTC